jgi:hypothetical protein
MRVPPTKSLFWKYVMAYTFAFKRLPANPSQKVPATPGEVQTIEKRTAPVRHRQSRPLHDPGFLE